MNIPAAMRASRQAAVRSARPAGTAVALKQWRAEQALAQGISTHAFDMWFYRHPELHPLTDRINRRVVFVLPESPKLSGAKVPTLAEVGLEP